MKYMYCISSESESESELSDTLNFNHKFICFYCVVNGKENTFYTKSKQEAIDNIVDFFKQYEDPDISKIIINSKMYNINYEKLMIDDAFRINKELKKIEKILNR